MADPQTKAHFIEPMLLPEGAGWEYEVKLDGYRAIAFRSGGHVHLRSRNNKHSTPASFKSLYRKRTGEELTPVSEHHRAASLPIQP